MTAAESRRRRRAGSPGVEISSPHHTYYFFKRCHVFTDVLGCFGDGEVALARSLVPTAETSCALTPKERGLCGRMQHMRINGAHFIGWLVEFPGIDKSSGNPPRVSCWFTTVGEQSRKSRFTRVCDEITAHRQFDTVFLSAKTLIHGC